MDVRFFLSYNTLSIELGLSLAATVNSKIKRQLMFTINLLKTSNETSLLYLSN